MKNFLVGKKTFLVMGVALVVALFQHFVAPIPAVDPDLWAIAVPVVGIILRFVTHQPVSFRDMLSVFFSANKVRARLNEKETK